MEIVGVLALALLFLFFLSLLMGGPAGEDRSGVPVRVIIQPAAEQTQQGSAFLVMLVVAILLLIIFAMMQAP